MLNLIFVWYQTCCACYGMGYEGNGDPCRYCFEGEEK